MMSSLSIGQFIGYIYMKYLGRMKKELIFYLRMAVYVPELTYGQFGGWTFNYLN